MVDETLAQVQHFLVVAGILIALFLFLIFIFWIVWKREGIRGDRCPYCKRPLRLGADVALSLAGIVNAFLQEEPQPENPPIDFLLASYCPQTGRIFPNTVTGKEHVILSWDFLKRCWLGTFISWGVLSEEERGVLRLLHGSLDGFQTEHSSNHVVPESVEEEFSSLAPGPLYVDQKTKVVIGWKKVPGTYFEVLVVQQPKFQSLDETL